MLTHLPLPSNEARTHSNKLCELIHRNIATQGGWIPFARYMELALYAPGLGYYTAGSRKFGSQGDFVTAPEISTLFGRALARQLAEIIKQSLPFILELGAGSGKLAADVLLELERMDCLPQRYDILEVSADLRQRQQTLLHERLPHLIDRVNWLETLPENIRGAVIANEVLDALPVQLLRWRSAADGQGGQILLERGVSNNGANFIWEERPSENAALLESAQNITVPDDYLSEFSIASHGLIASLCSHLQQGTLLFIDYGFGASEYYHPQRSQGTLMCHYRHHAHDDPFYLPGLQDITAHVDFTAIADTAIDNGAELLGYTTQAFFLINCGIADLLAESDPENLREYLPLSTQLQKLTSPAEMGELFKVIALGKGMQSQLCGFYAGDKSRFL